MAYSTLSDILDIIPESFVIQLTDDSGAGVFDTTKIDKAIADADELIDGYLRGRYTLPLDPVPGLIGKLSTDIAIFNLYSRRPELEMPTSVVKRYDSAIKILDQIQAGKVTLGIGGEEIPEPGTYRTNKTEDDRIFNSDLLKKF